MKEKTIAMATAFSMLLAIGVTGIGTESLHQSPAYNAPQAQVQQMEQGLQQMQIAQYVMLPAPEADDL